MTADVNAAAIVIHDHLCGCDHPNLCPDVAAEPCMDAAAEILASPAVPADDEAAKRCPSCEHTMGFHQPEGCWYTVTDGKPGGNLVCVCEVSIGALAALREGQQK